jgi:hypothetical protein
MDPTGKRFAPPTAHVADVDPVVPTSVAPALWNPGAAMAWSLLFSPIFGAFVHMKNWQALGETDKAATSKTWAVTSLAFILAVILLGVFIPESKGMDLLSRIAGLGLLVAWYSASGKHQVSYVKARFGKSYPRRGWLKPICLALLAVLGLFGAIFVVVFVGELLLGR